jgi:hypothetical protein
VTSPRDPSWAAGRLIQWGLRPVARPAQEPEYRETIDWYLDDPVFRTAVRGIASGLGLQILDVSDHGVVLAPSEDSVFALRSSDFRPGTSKADDRLLDGLVQVAIAATVFPRAQDLDDDPDIVRPPVTIDEVDAQLRHICEQLAQSARTEVDPATSDETRGLTEAWRVYMQRMETLETRDARKAMRATRRIIEFALERLREFGCFTQIAQGDEASWQPTRRYHVMVQQLAATRIFELVREALDRGASQEAP